MKLLLLLSLLFFSAFCYEDKYLTQLVYKYIYNNEKLCGDPFRESDWLPSMGDCAIDCEPTQFICLTSTTTNNLQKCRELSYECSTSLRKYLGWSPALERTSSSTSSSIPSTIVSILNQTSDFTENKILQPIPPSKFREPAQYAVKNLKPISTIISDYLVPTPTFSSISNDANSLEPALIPNDQLVEPFERPIQNVLKYTPLATNIVSENYKPTVETTSKVPLQPIDRFVASKSLYEKMEAEQKFAAEMAYGKRKASVVAEPLNKDPLFGTPMMPSSAPKDYLPIAGTRFEIVPPLPPTDPPIGKASQYAMKSKRVSEGSRDYSANCCEWALSGLCDRSWKKVRRICPKSCGSLICEEVEGIQSCTRVVDVDVEECYETVRLARYFGLKNVQVEEKKKLIEDILTKKAKNKKKSKSRKSKKKRRRA